MNTDKNVLFICVYLCPSVVSTPDRLQQLPRREAHDGEEDSEADDDHRQLAAAREVAHLRLIQEYAQAHPHRSRRAVLDGYVGVQVVHRHAQRTPWTDWRGGDLLVVAAHAPGV